MTPLLLLSAVLTAPGDPGVAFALEVKGAATVEQGGKPAPLDDGDALRDGDKLAVKPGGAVTVYFRPAGPVVVLAGPAEATVRPGRLDSAAAVAVREVKVPARAAAGLERDVKSDLIGGGTPPGGKPDAPPPAVRPVAGRTVAADRPDFSWPAVPGAKSYRVELTQVVRGEETRAAWAAESGGNRLAYPAGKNPLERGKEYLWRVTAGGGEDPVFPDERFKVLDKAGAEELAGLAALERGTDPNDWLIAAVAYSGLGLTDEPIRVLRKLAEARPDSALVRKMLAEQYKVAGLTEEAKKIRAKPDDEKK